MVTVPSQEIQFCTLHEVITLPSSFECRKTLEREKEENFGETGLGRLRKTLWDLFEYPASSRWAKVGGSHFALEPTTGPEIITSHGLRETG